jgi:putative redox protein
MISATQSERIFFRGHTGDNLAARLESPTAQPLAYALFTHCFTCSKDYHAVTRISRSLAAKGIAVLRFDFTGLGESEGDFADTNFSSNLEDLLLAADFLRQKFAAPELLIGHSLGGSAVLAAANSIPESKAVVTIAAPSDPGNLHTVLSTKAPEIETEGEAEVSLAGRTFRIKRQLLEDLKEHRLLNVVGGLSRGLLVLHSPIDATVRIEHAHRIFDAAKHPKSFVAIPEADHLLGDRSATEYVASVISAWVSRYITRAEEARAEELRAEEN